MDDWLRRIGEFATAVSYEDLPADVVGAAKERLLDSLGCAVGALGVPGGCPPAEIGRSVATTPGRPEGCGWVVGSAEPLSAESAAFVNGCLIRYLDFSDTYPGHHPSDALGAIFAVAPAVGASGRQLITALAISYEISIRLIRSGRFNTRGWDNGYSTGIGAAAATARLMGLDRDQVCHAIAITATANMPLRATRSGQLSMWKGAATAYSVRDAVFAAQLAGQGMTGPEAPFTGRHGVMDLITGPMDLEAFGTEGGQYLLPKVKLKYWPLVHNMQPLVWAGLKLRRQLAGRTATRIEVFTVSNAKRESGSEPEKWDPRTRETADHSAPYILAHVLRHGTIGHAAFEPEAFLDPTLRPEMQRIEIVADDSIDAVYPDTVRMRVVAADEDGRQHDIEIINPLGHDKNPMTSEDIEAKFSRLASPLLPAGQIRRAIDTWREVEATDAATALGTVTVSAPPGPGPRAGDSHA